VVRPEPCSQEQLRIRDYHRPMRHVSLPLWPLALACALLPVLATHTAWWLSVSDGHVPFCIPYLEGCTSISRAARHGLGNHVFRAMMLPTAMLQILLWLAAWQWLKCTHPKPGVGASLAALGLVAGVFLILYATFLGTEGDIYRLLRRYGVIVYFAATYIAQLVLQRALRELPAHRAHAVMLGVCIAMLGLGVVSTAVSALVDDEGLKDRWENVLEWNLGAFLTLWFCLLAWRWRSAGLRLALYGREG
jgi:hypothetical protein